MQVHSPVTRFDSSPSSAHWVPLLIVAASVAVAVALINLVMVHLVEPPSPSPVASRPDPTGPQARRAAPQALPATLQVARADVH